MVERSLVGLCLRIRNSKADDVSLIFAEPTVKVGTERILNKQDPSQSVVQLKRFSEFYI